MGLTTAWRKSGLLKKYFKKNFLIIHCHCAMETPLASLSLPHRQSDMSPLPENTFQGSEYAKEPPFFINDSFSSLL